MRIKCYVPGCENHSPEVGFLTHLLNTLIAGRNWFVCKEHYGLFDTPLEELKEMGVVK
jgi:hypothetical protein